MTDYTELIKRLRAECALPYQSIKTMRDAADAIEQLQRTVDTFDRDHVCRITEHDGVTEFEIVPRWISVKERLPKYGDWVLGIGPKKGYYVCEYRGISHFPYSGDDPWFSAKGRALTITHWMPLPAPPKEDEA